MAADRVLKALTAAIFIFGTVTVVHAQPLDAAAPSAEPMPGFPEWIDLEANAALLRKAQGIGDKPLIVLTASSTATDPMIPEAQRAEASRIHQELQRELTGLSTRSRQVIAASAGHNIQREEPQLIVDAVLEVVKQLRNRK
jgi:pimeloyl-ACP methyl ester carboxylesterase